MIMRAVGWCISALFFWSMTPVGGAVLLIMALGGLWDVVELVGFLMLMAVGLTHRTPQPRSEIPYQVRRRTKAKTKAWLGRGVPSHVSLPVPQDWPY